MSDPPINITEKMDEYCPTGVVNIEPYVRAVPSVDLNGYSLFEELIVEVVYRQRASSAPLDFVHVMTKRKNVYLVVIVDVEQDRIYGHYLLDLNKEYGIDAANEA